MASDSKQRRGSARAYRDALVSHEAFQGGAEACDVRSVGIDKIADGLRCASACCIDSVGEDIAAIIRFATCRLAAPKLFIWVWVLGSQPVEHLNSGVWKRFL